jgi:uncharacterized membrane protein YecN with MAPEG domain
MLLNVAQRAAGNYQEQLPQIITLTLLAGLFFPCLTAGIAAVYIVARGLYTAGFKSMKGPGRRATWFGLIILAQLVLFVLTVLGGLRFTGVLNKA